MDDELSRFETRFLHGGVRRASPPPWLKQKRKWNDTPKRRAYARLYNSKAWKELRERVLTDHPVCQSCNVRLSCECDHVIPHRLSEDLFFSRDNLQALCRACHVAKSARNR